VLCADQRRIGQVPRWSPTDSSLARALREIGCLERTLFILDWISDPALRRRSNAGLNKGEARNALARALFFHRHGEIRDRTFENQRYRASGLNLTIAATTLCNTVYFGHAVAELRAQSETLPPIRCSATLARSAGNTSVSMATTSGRPNRSRMGFGR
jgi:TnpA family transposase